MAVGHVHAADWLLDRRNLQALPRLAPVYDLAHKSCHGCALQHVARPADLRCQGPRWYHPRALLLLRFCRLHLLQSVFLFGPWARGTNRDYLRLFPHLSLYRPLKLLVDLLDGSSQSHGQPAVWRQPRFGHGRSHL